MRGLSLMRMGLQPLGHLVGRAEWLQRLEPCDRQVDRAGSGKKVEHQRHSIQAEPGDREPLVSGTEEDPEECGERREGHPGRDVESTHQTRAPGRAVCVHERQFESGEAGDRNRVQEEQQAGRSWGLSEADMQVDQSQREASTGDHRPGNVDPVHGRVPSALFSSLYTSLSQSRHTGMDAGMTGLKILVYKEEGFARAAEELRHAWMVIERRQEAKAHRCASEWSWMEKSMPSRMALSTQQGHSSAAEMVSMVQATTEKFISYHGSHFFY